MYLNMKKNLPEGFLMPHKRRFEKKGLKRFNLLDEFGKYSVLSLNLDIMVVICP